MDDGLTWATVREDGGKCRSTTFRYYAGRSWQEFVQEIKVAFNANVVRLTYNGSPVYVYGDTAPAQWHMPYMKKQEQCFPPSCQRVLACEKKDGVLNMVDLVPVPPPHTIPFCGHHELVLVFNLLGAFGDGRGFA